MTESYTNNLGRAIRYQIFAFFVGLVLARWMEACLYVIQVWAARGLPFLGQLMEFVATFNNNLHYLIGPIFVCSMTFALFGCRELEVRAHGAFIGGIFGMIFGLIVGPKVVCGNLGHPFGAAWGESSIVFKSSLGVIIAVPAGALLGIALGLVFAAFKSERLIRSSQTAQRVTEAERSEARQRTGIQRARRDDGLADARYGD